MPGPCSRLDGLLRQREGGQATTSHAWTAPQVPDISALLTGFAAPTGRWPPSSSTCTASWPTSPPASPAFRPGSADHRHRRHRPARAPDRRHRSHRLPPPVHPRTVRPATGVKRALIHQDHYRLTLWCEHPGYEHPWEPAAYDLDPPKEWLTRIAPYAVLVFRTLQLIVPLAGAVAIAALPTAQQSSAQAHLEVMKDLRRRPAQHDRRHDAEAASLGSTGQLTAAEGAALRAIRAIIFEHDQLRAFGGLRRVQAPCRRPALGLREPLPRLRSWPARHPLSEPTGRCKRCQTGSERLIMPDTCPGRPTARRLACSGHGRSVP